jgi:hypothetical protein
MDTKNLSYQFTVNEKDGYCAIGYHLVHLLNGTNLRTVATPGDAYVTYNADNTTN